MTILFSGIYFIDIITQISKNIGIWIFSIALLTVRKIRNNMKYINGRKISDYPFKSEISL